MEELSGGCWFKSHQGMNSSLHCGHHRVLCCLSRFFNEKVCTKWIKQLQNTAQWIWGGSIFSPIKPKLDNGLFVDVCVFTCFYQFLHDVIIILFCRSKRQFYDRIMQKLVKIGKNTEINKQSDVKFWLIWSCLIFIKL